MSEPHDPDDVTRLASAWLTETFPNIVPDPYSPSLALLLEAHAAQAAKTRDAEWWEALFPGHPGLHPSPREAAAAVEDVRKDAVAKAKAPPRTQFPKARKALKALKTLATKPEAQAYLPPKTKKAKAKTAKTRRYR
jgi:hypothetical protein